MGVEVETIHPGDGENGRLCVFCVFVSCSSSSSSSASFRFVSPSFQERLTRRRASASWCTTWVSGEAAPAGAPERRYHTSTQISATVGQVKLIVLVGV